MSRQGEVRHLEYGSTVFTVVVISNDSWNSLYPPIVAPIKQRGLPDLPPAFVALNAEADPFKGVVDITDLTSSSGGALADDVLGTVIGATMNRIRQAVTDVVDD